MFGHDKAFHLQHPQMLQLPYTRHSFPSITNLSYHIIKTFIPCLPCNYQLILSSYIIDGVKIFLGPVGPGCQSKAETLADAGSRPAYMLVSYKHTLHNSDTWPPFSVPGPSSNNMNSTLSLANTT